MELDEINRDCPEHDRNSCNDKNLHNRGVDFTNGNVWCRRCEALYQFRQQEKIDLLKQAGIDLTYRLCGVGVVSVDGHDVISRNSAMDLVTAYRKQTKDL